MGKTIKILAVYTAIVLLGAFLLKDFSFFHTAINLITALVMFGVVFYLMPGGFFVGSSTGRMMRDWRNSWRSTVPANGRCPGKKWSSHYMSWFPGSSPVWRLADKGSCVSTMSSSEEQS